ncbi:hypothetical protein L7F22_011020 [Adiantum nelumboides]|nr:hypothetical protein [Adiantum nelumboides]
MRDTPTSNTTVGLLFMILLLVRIGSVFASFQRHGRLLQTIDTHELLTSSSSQQGGADRSKTGTHLQKQAIIGIAVGALALGSILLCLLLYWLMQKPTPNALVEAKKIQPQSNLPEDQQSWSRAFSSLQHIGRASRSSALSNFSEYALLKAATNNFGTDNLLGSGGSGCIYKARLTKNLFAAVKLLKPYPAVGPRVQREFQRED